MILITGATGFIGRPLLNELIQRNNNVIAAVRSEKNNLPYNVLQAKMNDVFDLESAQMMHGMDTVIHCAARAHVLHEHTTNPLIEFRKTNTIGTLNLAKQAIVAGVKRFVFISTIGVLGNLNEQPFSESDTPDPQGAYAISKYEAELGLLELAKKSSLEVVIIRPPLAYGPNVPGNFSLLLHWMYKNIPLPFKAIDNKRSFVALDNLVDFIIVCAEHPAAANEIFLVADDEDLSTSELLNRVSILLGKKARLFSINQKLLEFCLNLVGKKDLAQRLCKSLQVDISKAKRLLNWSPKIKVDEGLQKMTKFFLQTKI